MIPPLAIEGVEPVGGSAVELVFALLVAVTILAGIARRARIADPILLLLAGVAIGFIPGLPAIELEPDVVFVLFLPPILYSAGYFSSLRDFKANLRPILLLSVGLVLFTAVVVAVVAESLVPELPWGAAFALGAIVAPPDAVAATTIFRRLGVPRRIVTILEGESLVNDATALVAYRTAILAVGGTVSLVDAGGSFVIVGVGGILVGLGGGWLVDFVFRRIDDPTLLVVLSLMAPAGLFIVGEELGVSGVLAVVVGGLILGRRANRVLSSAQRLQGEAAWGVVLFLINSLVFVLIGLQLPAVLEAVTQVYDARQLAILAAAVSLAAIVARFVWVFPATYVPRWLSPALRRRDPAPRAGAVVIIGWAGMRGVVSLAAALALPFDFPGRDLILFLTFAVILATLVGQGLTLPLLIRAVGLAPDRGGDAEELLARRTAVEAARARIDELEVEWPTHRELIDELRTRYEHRDSHLDPADGPADEMDEAEQELLEHGAIKRAIIDAERAAVIGLRDDGTISDDALRQVIRELDLEELRMEA